MAHNIYNEYMYNIQYYLNLQREERDRKNERNAK